MKLYLAGPMTGRPQFNMQAFDEAAEVLGREHFVYNPHDVDRGLGFDWADHDGDYELAAGAGHDLQAVMREHLRWITTTAEGIALLPGWSKSNGTRREVLVAKTIGLPIFVYLLAGELCEINVDVDAGVSVAGWAKAGWAA